MMKDNWWIEEHRLDDEQKDFVYNKDINSKNYWIRGFPGSGKSVLLAYTIKKIRKDKPNADIAVVVFTHSLIKMFKAAFVGMGQYADIMTFFDRRLVSCHYDYVLCDEVQDFVPTVLNTIRQNGTHIVAAGDENQSIFEEDPRYHQKTVQPHEITSLLNAEPFTLNVIHRLSRSIINLVQKFLPSIKIFASKRDMTKEDTEVRLCNADNYTDEARYILKIGEKAANVGKTVAVLFPTQDKALYFAQTTLEIKNKSRWNVCFNQYGRYDFGGLNNYLVQNGIKMQYVGNSYGDFSEDNGKITLMTYHSSKGLDFDTVFIPGLNKDLFITPGESLSKRVFMVAMTRSRGELYLTYSGTRSDYLESFLSDCHKINISEALADGKTTAGSSNIFGI